jgi:flavin-binding protein dodecin
MTHVAKVIQIIGSSQSGWEEAAQVAIDHGIHGLEITDRTAKVNPHTGKITEYRAGVKISFAVEH